MQWKRIRIVMIGIVFTFLTACSNQSAQILNPDKPITINLWHYYDGTIKVEFDALVSEFNETIGTDRGVIVEAKSYGTIAQLEAALFAAAQESVGSSPLPEVFAAYADQAYEMAQMIKLVPLENYFSEEELLTYREEFLQEGQFLNDDKTYILPIAKSTENLFVNKTDWDIFAKSYGFTNDDLRTWEGIYNVAKKYYEETGESFYSHDSHANFMVLLSKQLGNNLISINDDGEGTFILDENGASAIWKYLYIPYMNGYYKKMGRFSSDDAKTGSIIAFVSSTSGGGYFPKEVTTVDKDIYAIEHLILPYPYIDAANRFVVQQGAGMIITESDKAREYGASLFLKWFTEIENNLEFSMASGYFPVKTEVYEKDMLLEMLDDYGITNPVIRDSFIVTNQMFKDYTLYSSPPFENSHKIREVVGSHLYNKIVKDLDILTVRIKNGESRQEVLAEMTSDEQFNKWFTSFKEEAEVILQ